MDFSLTLFRKFNINPFLMKFNLKTLNGLLDYFSGLNLLPSNARQYMDEMVNEQFTFHKQLMAAESIHLHIKVADVNKLPQENILRKGANPQNAKDGYIKYAFPNGINFIFSSIPVSQEEKAGLSSFSFPHLDHIGIDIRDESDKAYSSFNEIPRLASALGWPVRKQGGEGKKVYCCHVQVNEKYWVYPPEGVYWEFAFGQLIVSDKVFGCDLRPADPSLALPEEILACCGSENHQEDAYRENHQEKQYQTYYDPADLKQFGAIGNFQKPLADHFFKYYGEVFKEGALSAREKSLIALAVAHTVQCPYCIDAYSVDSLKKGYTNEQMMEAIHVAASIRAGASLVHSVQMMNKVNSMKEHVH
jgi:alkylhydroperoxidase/carboxymuconolactone decarboxylase family protein